MDAGELKQQVTHWLQARPSDTDTKAWLQWSQRELAEFWQLAEHLEFKAEDTTRVCYCVWAQPEPSPWLVVSPGRVENYEKYKEVALEWAAQGYSIAIIDHRGQGFSDRLTPRYDQGHIANFTDYVDDFAQFMHGLAPRIGQQDAYLLGHSMGSAIAALYLAEHGQREPAFAFKAAALCAPMLGIHTDPWPEPVGKAVVRMGAWLNRKLAPNKPSYFIGMKDYAPVRFAENELTHSEARYQFIVDLYENEPRLRVGGPTWQWLTEALRAMALLPSLAPHIPTPLLVLQAGADKIVSPAPQHAFCKRLSHKGSRLEVIPGSQHEVLMESDSIRQPAVQLIQDYFQQPWA